MKISSFVGTLLVVGCTFGGNKKNHAKTEQKQLDVMPQKKMRYFVTDISQLNSDSSEIYWAGGGLLGVHFEKNKVFFLFNFKCNYWYPTKVNKQKILFYWAQNSDCDFDRGLNRKFEGIANPSKDKPFGQFELINDTTLQLKYFYPDWRNRINKEVRDVDTLFPVIFKIRQPDSS